MKAVILAGGKGTRLQPLTFTVPKPLVIIGDRPVLFHLLDTLQNQGIDEAVITLGYLGNKIEEALKNCETDMKISFSYEDKPLGTAGAVKRAAKDIDGDFLVLSGDAYCEFDCNAVADFHRKNNSLVTIVTTKVDDPREYGLVVSSKEGMIKRFIEKPGWSQQQKRS